MPRHLPAPDDWSEQPSASHASLQIVETDTPWQAGPATLALMFEIEGRTPAEERTHPDSPWSLHHDGDDPPTLVWAPAPHPVRYATGEPAR